jgi:predicted amidohydrolase
MTENLKIACMQMRSTTDVSENVDVFSRMVVQATQNGARYIQSPEMTGLVESSRAALMANIFSEAEDPIVAAAKKLAQQYDVYIHIGSTPILLADGKVANRGFVINPDGTKQCHYDKLHMFDVDLDNGESWRESATYQAGDQARIANIDGIKLGMGICYDVRFPELFKAQSQAGAQILTAPAAFTKQTGEAHWHILQRARAIENGAFMISAEQGGKHADGRETYGHSIVVSPWGQVIAELDHDEPDILYAEIELSAVDAARGKIPNLKNDQQFKITD